jgi:hypothetical protein
VIAPKRVKNPSNGSGGRRPKTDHPGEYMYDTTAPCHYRTGHIFLRSRPMIVFLILLLGLATVAVGEDVSPATNSPVALRVTHLLGFAGARKNAKGTLTIQSDALQFQKKGMTPVEIKISTIQDVFLGNQSKQVGGLPMALGKAAIPYSGGRAVSLFSHKKYDTLTLEYLDADGGLHGAIFELKKGQAETFRNELLARGAQVSEPTKQIAEAASENK